MMVNKFFTILDVFLKQLIEVEFWIILKRLLDTGVILIITSPLF